MCLILTTSFLGRLFLREFGERALVDRKRLVARRPAPLGNQPSHIVARRSTTAAI
jgi:hypothetical protein